MIDLATLRTGLANLEAQHNRLHQLDSNAPRLTREGITEIAVIPTFICDTADLIQCIEHGTRDD